MSRLPLLEMPRGRTPIAPVPRPPLGDPPLCKSCAGGPYAYDRVLPWDPPHERDFLRGNAWSVTVPGLPWVPGSSSYFPERFLSYIAYKYTPEWQRAGWVATAERSYTHTVTSWSNFRDEYSSSPQAFIDFCGGAKQYVPYVMCFFSSKDYDPTDLRVQEYQETFGPVLEALLQAKVIDEAVPGWEWDLFNIPGQTTIEIFKWVGQQAHARGVSTWAHFSKEKTSWFADGDPRGRYGFWDDLGPDVDGINYQGDQFWDVGELQARLVDTLKQFAQQGNRHKIRAFELIAMNQFDGHPVGNAHPNEDDGDWLGYLACCTAGPAPVWGYGNGGRLPSGGAL